MFKIGPKMTHNCSCNKANQAPQQHVCTCSCHSQVQNDSFEKTKPQTDKISLKKALPLGAVAGLASAGLVMIGNEFLNKALKTSHGLATTIAVGVGIGVANGVINGTIANMATKQAMAENDVQNKKELIA